VKNFVDAVLDGAPLLSSGGTALWTDWVTAQAVKSNETLASRHSVTP